MSDETPHHPGRAVVPFPDDVPQSTPIDRELLHPGVSNATATQPLSHAPVNQVNSLPIPFDLAMANSLDSIAPNANSLSDNNGISRDSLEPSMPTGCRDSPSLTIPIPVLTNPKTTKIFDSSVPRCLTQLLSTLPVNNPTPEKNHSLLMQLLEVLLATTSGLCKLESRGVSQLVEQLQLVLDQQTENINSALAACAPAAQFSTDSQQLISPQKSVASLKQDVLRATSEVYTLRLALASFKEKMSQSHATDEFHSRHLSTMVSDSVEQYMGHFQHNQNILLERLSSLELKLSNQLAPSPVVPESHTQHQQPSSVLDSSSALLPTDLASSSDSPPPSVTNCPSVQHVQDVKLPPPKLAEKRSLLSDSGPPSSSQLSPSKATVYMDLGFINAMVPFALDDTENIKPMVPEGVEKFYSANIVSPLLPTGYTMLPEPLATQSEGPRFIIPSLIRLHNEIARAMPQLINDGPKSTLLSADRDAYLLSLGIPFLQMFQLQVRRLVYAGTFPARRYNPLAPSIESKLQSGLDNLSAQNRVGKPSLDGSSAKFQRLGDIPADQPYYSYTHPASTTGGTPTYFAGFTPNNEVLPP